MKYAITALILCTMLVLPAQAGGDRKESVRGGRMAIGLILGAIGTTMAVQALGEADRNYQDYRSSAFTENSRELRDRAEAADGWAAVGAAVLSVGAVAVVFSF